MFRKKFLSAALSILLLGSSSLHMSNEVKAISLVQRQNNSNNGQALFSRNQSEQALNHMINYGLRFGPQYQSNRYSYEISFCSDETAIMPVQEVNTFYYASQLFPDEDNPYVSLYLTVKDTDGSEVCSILYQCASSFKKFSCNKLRSNPGDDGYDIIDNHYKKYCAFNWAIDRFINQDNYRCIGIYSNFNVDDFLTHFDEYFENDMETLFGLYASEEDDDDNDF